MSNEGLVLVFVPSLAALILRAEEKKGSTPDINDEKTEADIKVLAELNLKAWMDSFAQLWLNGRFRMGPIRDSRALRQTVNALLRSLQFARRTSCLLLEKPPFQ
jgi:hypothetical protein